MIISFDTEGANDYRGFISAAFIGPDFQHYFEKRLDALDFILSYRTTKSLFVATNLDYDLAMIFGRNFDLLKYFYADSRLLYATFNDNTNNVQFRDTVRAIGFYSVATLGKMVGIEKLPTPRVLVPDLIDRPLWVCDKHDEVECIECYCINDALITREAYIMFDNQMKEFNSELKPTIAATSVSLWQRSTLKKLQRTLDRSYDEQVRESYYGGRTEVFKVGLQTNVNEYDVNSLYPYVMSKFSYPDTDKLSFHSFDHNYSKISDREGVANVDISCPNSYIPVLPYRYGDKLIFPTGSFTGTYTLPELRFAVQHGCKIDNVNWSLTTFETLRPFERHINLLYNLRLQYKAQNNPAEQVVKILMNSLYGKFGQRQRGSLGWLREITDDDFNNPINPVNVYEFNETAMVIDSFTSKYTPTYLNVMWAAYITSYARIHLYSLMEQLDFSVYYCDTDAIFTSSTLETGENLGQVKLEFNTPRAFFISPKFYHYIDSDGNPRYKVKGVPAKNQQEYYDGNQVTFTIPVSIIQGLKSGLVPASWKIITRNYHYSFDKRRLLPRDTKGFTGYLETSPIELIDGEPSDLIDSKELKSFIESMRDE